MNRRTFLASCLVGAGGLAGCTELAPGSGEPVLPTGATARGTPEPASGRETPIPETELRRSVARDAIPAITEPAFAADWERVAAGPLAPHDRVIGVERDGETRAYPLRVLNWHEAVNDALGGPLLVTYCPLCASGVTARRTVRGEETVFGVSGLLLDSNLVLYDRRTGSLWSQIDARAIRGPATGETLSLVPSTVTTWEPWRDTHPDTRVLLPPPASGTIADAEPRDYDTDPYAGYDPYDGFRAAGGADVDDVERVGGFPHPKEWVVGVTADGAAKAYPLGAVSAAGVVNDTVGDRPVVVAVGRDGWTLVAYSRRVGGRALRFERADAAHLSAGGSRWRIATGRAVDGPRAGTTLTPVGDGTMFWFTWDDRHPGAAVYGLDASA